MSLLDLRPLLFFGLLFSLTSCQNWPPYETKAREHFADNRDTFEKLAEKMRGTDYWRVSIDGVVGETDVRVTPDADSDFEEGFNISDDPEWHELLASVGMFMVLQNEGAVWTNDGTGMWGDRDNRVGHSGFTHDPNMLDKFVKCQPGHEEILCGRCAVPLDGNWYIHYLWYPEYFSEKEWKSYLGGEIPENEYFESRNKADRQCHIVGYTKMGYDIEKVFDLDEE